MQIDNDQVYKAFQNAYPFKVDLENCDREPIQHIQLIQEPICLIAVDAESLRIKFVSDNSKVRIGVEAKDVMDRPLREAIGNEAFSRITYAIKRDRELTSVNPIEVQFEINGEKVLRNIILHYSGEFLVVEIEPFEVALQTTAYHMMLSTAVRKIQSISNYDLLFSETARVIRRLTDFDRVLVYKFDAEYNGEVIAEALTDGLEPYLGLRYPHTDIPKQARELYLRNKVRMICNLDNPPATLLRSKFLVAEQHLDLSMANGRGVSPVHAEYLSYMGVKTTMSIAIILDGKLWGLFALHHNADKFIDYTTRQLLLFLGQIFSGHLSLQAAGRYQEESLGRNVMRLEIGQQISKAGNLFEGLKSGRYSLLDVFPEVKSAIVSFDGTYESFGEAPPRADIEQLIESIKEQHDPDELVFQSSSLSKEFKFFEEHCDQAAGILLTFLNPERTEWIGWFRPSVPQTISWAGRPVKEIVKTPDGSHRMSPRKSFEKYIESVEDCSTEWTRQEVDSALAFRSTIMNSLLRHYAEVKQINERLKKAYEDLETFSYTVSHDLRAPLRAIDGYAEILHEDYQEVLDSEAHGLLLGIQRGVKQMNNFITDILELSRVGSGGLQGQKIDVSELVSEVATELKEVYDKQDVINIEIADNLPDVQGDIRMLRQLFSNLLSNAYKYARPNEQGQIKILVSANQTNDGRPVFSVENTGAGIPEEYHSTIFEMFSRLNSSSDSEGTGVGLSIVERIVNRHNGEIWVNNEGLGVRFSFYLGTVE